MQVIAFDLFGTVFDLKAAPREEVKAYVSHVRQATWTPLTLPEGWLTLPLHADSREGIERLRQKFFVVTCSNAPLGVIARLSKNAGVSWDAIIPLEMSKVYKPKLLAYASICAILHVQPEEILMVTANETSGDLEEPLKLGMRTQRIRGGDGPIDIIELAKQLGA